MGKIICNFLNAVGYTGLYLFSGEAFSVAQVEGVQVAVFGAMHLFACFKLVFFLRRELEQPTNL